MKNSRLEPAACPRCDSIVFMGHIGGRLVSIDRFTIPVVHAKVLARYLPGSVFSLSVGQIGVYGSDFFETADHELAGLVHSCRNKWRIK